MAEKPAQENIQGGGIHLVKIKKPKLGRCQPFQKAGVKFTEGGAASPTNPE